MIAASHPLIAVVQSGSDLWIRAPALQFGKWSRADAWGALYFANVWMQVRRLVAELELGLLSLGGQNVGAEQVQFAWPKVIEYVGLKHHVVFRFKEDEVFWLRVAELLAVDLEMGTAEFWHHLRSRRHSTKKWHEPLALSPQHPEYFSERNPSVSHIKPKKEKLPGLRRRQGQVGKSDVELVVPHFMLESGGKVPRKICAKVDEYLRKQIKAGASGALVSLSYPTEKEEQLRRQL